MTPISNYKKFLTELVRKHMAILGPNIVRDAALQIPGLDIDASGEVTDIQGNPALVLEDLVNAYKGLSAPVSQLVLYNLLQQFPDIRAEYTQPMTKIRLTCSLTNKNQA
jgi:hypothetical protein